MLKSMTGFGRFEASEGDRKVTVEIKSVNHRYLELGIKVPKKLNFLEGDIRNELKKYVERGKVDVFITYENQGEGNECVRYNPTLAREYFECYARISEDLGIENDVRTSYIMRSPDVITIENEADDEEIIKSLVIKAIDGAAERLVETRIAEGERLKTDLIKKLDGMDLNVQFITEKSPIIAQEVTMFADKVCVDEELVRLDSHIKAMKEALINGGTIGRRLDFIAQEMNREANTTLSKTSDQEISDKAIELKTDIEKVREQIQNIE